MADHTITVANALSISGPSPTNKWNSFNWGANWGESGDLNFTIFQCLVSETVTLASQVYLTFTKVLSNSVSTTNAMDLCCLQDASGYNYILEGGVTDPDDRIFPSYTEESGSSPTYTEDTPSNPTYTED